MSLEYLHFPFQPGFVDESASSKLVRYQYAFEPALNFPSCHPVQYTYLNPFLFLFLCVYCVDPPAEGYRADILYNSLGLCDFSPLVLACLFIARCSWSIGAHIDRQA